MTYRVFSTFGALPVGTPFRLNKQIKNAGDAIPITWLKVSTRTARVNGNGAVFYFGQRDNVWIDPSVADALEAKEREDA